MDEVLGMAHHATDALGQTVLWQTSWFLRRRKGLTLDVGDKRFGTETLVNDFAISSTLWQKDDAEIGLSLSSFSAHLCESANPRH